MTVHGETALAQELLPIREVARQTGVNPVTLRAWERRYGLIQPQRTAKGHRLYGPEHIARIQQVLAWLERGVAVGQVKRLLQDARLPQSADSQWREQQQQWLGCIEQLAERSLDDRFNQALALYPSETLCRHLLLPLLLLNLSERAVEPGLWLCAWLASNAGCPTRVLDWAIPVADLSLAARQMAPRAVLLYGDQSLEPGHLQRLFAAVDCPLLLCGHAVSIHHEELADLPDLHLADDPLAAVHCLRQLGLLDGR
jgi:DNA-binding transcriptional MerR regulator